MTKPFKKVKRRPGSKLFKLEAFIKVYASLYRGGPTSFAQAASKNLGFLVTRQDVHKVLVNLGFTRKKRSMVPSLANASSRQQHRKILSRVWTRVDQLVFLDEHKIKPGDPMKRLNEYGYSRKGTSLPKNLRGGLPTVIPKCQLIAALGIVNHQPMLSGKLGNVGILTYGIGTPKLTVQEIVKWFRDWLAPILTPYPGPRSIVLLDNWRCHRKFQKVFEYLCHREGAMLLWNPTYSPDMNPIEKFFDVFTSQSQRTANLLQIGAMGVRRPYTKADLHKDICMTRLSTKAYRCVFEDRQ